MDSLHINQLIRDKGLLIMRKNGTGLRLIAMIEPESRQMDRQQRER